MIQLAVVDMAGTTIRDDDVIERSFRHALVEAGVEPDGDTMRAHLEFARRSMGQPKIEVLRTPLVGDEPRAQVANKHFEEAFAGEVAIGEVEALPGAETALTALRAGGVRVCLTTGLSIARRDQEIDVLGWRDLVDLVLAPGDGIRGRPHPDLVLAAVMRLAVDGVQNVAVAGEVVMIARGLARPRSTTELLPPFEHEHRLAHAREVGGGGEAVVPATDHDRVPVATRERREPSLRKPDSPEHVGNGHRGHRLPQLLVIAVGTRAPPY